MTDPTATPDAQVAEPVAEPISDPVVDQAPPEAQTPTEEPFDRDRALSTIRKFREEEKGWKREHKELEQLRKEREEAEMARLSREDQLAKQLSQREAELKFERDQSRDRQNHYELQLQASKLGVVDPEAAAKLLNWGDLEYDDEGRPTNLSDALSDLLERKPYLKAQPAPQAGTPRVATSPTNPATRTPPSGSRIYTAAELQDHAFYLANKDDIMRALRENRIAD